MALLEVVYIFIIPVLLIYYGVIPMNYRIPTLIAITVFLIGIMIESKWTKAQIGLSTKITTKAIILYSVFTIVGVWSIVIFGKELGYTPLENWQTNTRFLAFFIPLSVLQEIAFRGFLIPRLHQIFTDHTTVVLVNAGLFTILHIIYPEPNLMLPLAFAGGLGFAALYEFYPNIILVSISHTILNFFAVLYGFFSIIS